MASAGAPALVDDLAGRIRDRIMTGEFPVGSALRQSELAEEFGTSRTPVREALRQLQSTGLIEILPNRGAVVRIPTPWEVRELYEVRAELEALAVRRAASRLTRADLVHMRQANDALFDLALRLERGEGDAATVTAEDANEHSLHAAVHRAAGNDRLTKVLDEISTSFPRNVPAMLLLENARHREENHDEHARILDALEAMDAEAASRLMRQHVLSTGDQIARWYEQRSRVVMRD